MWWYISDEVKTPITVEVATKKVLTLKRGTTSTSAVVDSFTPIFLGLTTVKALLDKTLLQETL